jgi:hypothetical protein
MALTIHFVPHPCLVVAHSDADGTTVVLCPPGQQPAAILDVASVVLPEQRYRELADLLDAEGGRDDR